MNFLFFRRLLLKKRPTLKKLICAVVVTVTPVLYLIEKQWKQQSGWTVPVIAAIDCVSIVRSFHNEEYTYFSADFRLKISL